MSARRARLRCWDMGRVGWSRHFCVYRGRGVSRRAYRAVPGRWSGTRAALGALHATSEGTMLDVELSASRIGALNSVHSDFPPGSNSADAPSGEGRGDDGFEVF